MTPLGLIFLLGAASAQFCYDNSLKGCDLDEYKDCNAQFSGISHVSNSLSYYVKQHVSQSFDFLLMSTNFEHYEKNRDGFAKLFKKLSDSTWDDAIDLIKYITKRGGEVDFNALPIVHEKSKLFNREFEMYELQSLSQALDMQKTLAEVGHVIHSEVSKRSGLGDISHPRKIYHDAETMHYIEEKFVEKHANRIRDLAGYVTDLYSFVKGQLSDVAVFIFDEYLQKKLA